MSHLALKKIHVMMLFEMKSCWRRQVWLC